MAMADTKRIQKSKRLCALTVSFLIILLLHPFLPTAQARPPDKRSLPSPERLFSWGEDCKESSNAEKHKKRFDRIGNAD